MAKNDYIESLPIPESDKELLRRFEYEDYGGIRPELCESETARQEAEDMSRRALRREEYACGID